MNEDLAQYINLQDAMSRLRGNEKIYQTLLKSFMAGSYMEELYNELDKKDLETAAKTAHKIKGVSANLSLDKVHAMVMVLESQLKNGLDYEEALQELKEAMQKTLEYIKDLLADWPKAEA